MALKSISQYHRKLFVVAGSIEWARTTARKLTAPFNRCLWIGEPQHRVDSLPASKARHWLGREVDALVFDGFSGFDPDAFGAVSGTVVGGGLMVLLIPPLDHWADYPDPDKKRIAAYPHEPEQLKSGFVPRIARLIRENPQLTLLEEEQDDLPESLPLPPDKAEKTVVQLTADQEIAVDALIKVATGHSRRPLVLISDRGRGKSTALGAAAAQLLLLGKSEILISAPRPDAARTLLEQAGRLLPGHEQHGEDIRCDRGVIRFVAPDELIRRPQPADLLLVDEAAAIPTPMLERMLRIYNRVAFATTEHGYEGTGRGFTVRFTEILQRETPHWRRLRLHTPIRWAANDPLEAFVFRALLLDADVADLDADDEIDPDGLRTERLDRNTLLSDEKLLSQLFGLLVLSHYQTHPSDLRQLLDGPDLSVWVTRYRGAVVAAVLALDEGGFEKDLATAVWRGERRPRGHMMAQALTSHAGFVEAAMYRHCRIMRIAVHPVLTRKGLGSTLIRRVVEDARQRGKDSIGASFGATADLLGFWRHNEMHAVHLGVSRDAASGCHSAVVLQPLSNRGLDLYRRMRERFVTALPYALAEPLKTLEAEIALSLFEGDSNPETALSAKDLADLEAFAHGRRDYAGARLALWRLSCENVSRNLHGESLRILIVKVLQGHDWEQSARLTGLSGRKTVMAALRGAVAELTAN